MTLATLPPRRRIYRRRSIPRTTASRPRILAPHTDGRPSAKIPPTTNYAVRAFCRLAAEILVANGEKSTTLSSKETTPAT